MLQVAQNLRGPIPLVAILVLFGFLVVLAQMFKKTKSRTSRRSQDEKNRSQIASIATGNFKRRPVLNHSERGVFAIIDNALPQMAKMLPVSRYRLLAQVSLGEAVSTGVYSARMAVNAKRLDFLIVGDDMLPLVAIEYQGEGHRGSNSDHRDLVKQLACEQAGIAFIEIHPNDAKGDIIDKVSAALGLLPDTHSVTILSQRESATP